MIGSNSEPFSLAALPRQDCPWDHSDQISPKNDDDDDEKSFSDP